MLADGYWPGASTLIAGPAGSGKTLMGLHFVLNGARHGEPGVIATLQENPTQLQRVLASFGWSLNEPNVEVMYRSPSTSTSTNGSTTYWTPWSGQAPGAS